MGDRANVFVKMGTERHPEAGVYLYTHWGGTELPGILGRVLARKERWDDGPCLARIILLEMSRPLASVDDDGCGVSTYRPDNDRYPILIVDVKKGSVSLGEPDGEYDEPPRLRLPERTWSFEWFVALPEVTWDVLM